MDDVKNEGREDDRFAGTSASLRRFENKKEDGRSKDRRTKDDRPFGTGTKDDGNDKMEEGRSLISFAKKMEDEKTEGREDDRFAGTSASLRRFENKKEDGR